MKILKIVLLVLALLVAAFVIGGLVLSPKYEVQRSIVIRASPEQIHALVGDLKRWDEFMPWKEQDPTVAVTFGEQTSGVGASQTWTGKDGNGRIRFTKSDPKAGLEFELGFILSEDKTQLSQCALVYEPSAEGTKVTWTMTGESKDPAVIGPWFAKLMPSMVGPSFDQGLAKLKTRCEAP